MFPFETMRAVFIEVLCSIENDRIRLLLQLAELSTAIRLAAKI